jgi:hypothetical protein
MLHSTNANPRLEIHIFMIQKPLIYTLFEANDRGLPWT